MTPYITYRELNEGQLEYFILQKEFPHFSGKVVMTPVEGAIINSPIGGYNMWVTFNGTLRGNIIPNYRDIVEEIEHVYSNMAAWFWSERILTDKKKYEKFKIKTDATITK